MSFFALGIGSPRLLIDMDLKIAKTIEKKKQVHIMLKMHTFNHDYCFFHF